MYRVCVSRVWLYVYGYGGEYVEMWAYISRLFAKHIQVAGMWKGYAKN